MAESHHWERVYTPCVCVCLCHISFIPYEKEERANNKSGIANHSPPSVLTERCVACRYCHIALLHKYVIATATCGYASSLSSQRSRSGNASPQYHFPFHRTRGVVKLQLRHFISPLSSDHDSITQTKPVVIFSCDQSLHLFCSGCLCIITTWKF